MSRTLECVREVMLKYPDLIDDDTVITALAAYFENAHEDPELYEFDESDQERLGEVAVELNRIGWRLFHEFMGGEAHG